MMFERIEGFGIKVLKVFLYCKFFDLKSHTINTFHIIIRRNQNKQTE